MASWPIFALIAAALASSDSELGARAMQPLTATTAEHSKGYLSPSALRVMRRPPASRTNTIDQIGTDVAFATNAQIYGEGETSTYFYKIVTGLARCYRMTPDGRRQIVAFYVPGDLFGFEAGDRHALSVEAITASRVRTMKRTSILDAIARDESLAETLCASFGREIQHNQEHILQFGKPAQVRVASFLLEMMRRAPAASAEALPMSRQDVADYLELRIETVSRAMTRFAKAGAIAPSSRRNIAIRDAAALKQLVNQHSGLSQR